MEFLLNNDTKYTILFMEISLVVQFLTYLRLSDTKCVQIYIYPTYLLAISNI